MSLNINLSAAAAMKGFSTAALKGKQTQEEPVQNQTVPLKSKTGPVLIILPSIWPETL